MYWDEWIKAGAFVLLVAIGFGFHYLSTIDTSENPARGVAALAPRTDEAKTPAASALPTAEPKLNKPVAAPEPQPADPSAQSPTTDTPSAPIETPSATPTPLAPETPPPQLDANSVEPVPQLTTSPSAVQQSSPPAAFLGLQMQAPQPAQQPAQPTPPPAEDLQAAPRVEPPQAAPPTTTEVQPVQGGGDPMLALRAAARTDDARAQYALALAYKMGRGVPADPAQSLLWLRRSAQNGLAVAARALGIAYEEGIGVEKDPSEAAKWYTRAALSGDLQAMHNLAFFFTQGLGGMPRDGRQAAHWFRKAAERGLVASQVNLAILTSQGEQWGIEKKLSDAYFWSAIAAEHGDPQATKMRDLIAKLFAPKEKEDLDKKVAAFRPLPIDVIANGGFEVAPEAFLPKSLRPPLSASEVATIRQLLKTLGYSGNAARDPVGGATPGLAPTDAAMATDIDDKTELAIRAFQNDYGLPVSGVADRNLLAALKSVPH